MAARKSGFGLAAAIPKVKAVLHHARFVALAATLQVAPSHGQDVYWIGRPTTRDYMALNVQRALNAYGDLRLQLARFESDMAEARQAYFTAPAPNRTAADQFGYLLFQKDLLIAMPKIIGNKDQAEMMGAVLSLGNLGRPIDGGVTPSARRAFNEWVSAVRMSAGAGLGTASAPDPVKAAAAMNNSASLREYEVYRRLRDQAEVTEWESRRTSTPLKFVGPPMTYRASHYFGENVTMKGFDYHVAKVPQKIIQCIYSGRQVNGSVFNFWQEQAPENIGFLMAMNPRAFEGLKDHAVALCPPDSKQANAIASSPSKVVITREMARDAQAQARSAPADPARVRAIQERNAAVRQKMEDDRVGTEARNAQYRACSENLRAAMATARAARDTQARSAAHAEYAECTAELRTHDMRR